MSDLINGREMLNRYQVDLCYGIACKDCSMSTEEGDCRVEKWIDTFPSADRPQGEWKRRLVDNGFNADWVCSECGYRVKTDFVSFNFCPNCGCRMKGVDDE